MLIINLEDLLVIRSNQLDTFIFIHKKLRLILSKPDELDERGTPVELGEPLMTQFLVLPAQAEEIEGFIFF